MKNQKVVSHFSPELVTEAGVRAAVDAPFAKLLTQADHAGKVAGASVNASEAGNFWAELADKISPCAAYAASVGGPVTLQAISQAGLEDKGNSQAFMIALDKCDKETVTPEQAGKVNALRDKARDSAGAYAMLDGMRGLCGLVSVGVKAAQTAARLTAINECKAAEIAKRAKLARDKIIKRLDRALLIYGLKIDWQACIATAVEAKEPPVETDAEKAVKALARAFSLDASACIEALAQSEPAFLLTMVEALKPAVKAAQAAAQLKRTEAEKVAGEVVKGEHNAIGARKAQRDAA